ncbi:MAG: pantothenate kinase [Nanoarchaeota archaeon]
MILGIDFGSSNTDAVLMKDESIKKTLSFKKDERLDFVLFKLANEKIDKIAVTGAYGHKYYYQINNIPVKQIDEIKAIGLGGLYVGKKKEALVVSIGSGTAMVSCKKEIKHIGGTPIGGKTFTGLAKLLLNTEDLSKIEKLAAKGNLNNIDLNLKEIYPKGIGLLPPTATAAHFGSFKDYDKNDIALALINMIAQSIGTLAVFGAKATGHQDIILTGRLTKIKLFKKIILDRINTLSCIPVTIPADSEYATAIGSVIGESIGVY